jgi:Ca-activated chloride channel family protein
MQDGAQGKVNLFLGLVVLLLFLLFPAGFIHAQEAAPSPPNGSHTTGMDDTIRVETDLVDLNVAVFSRDHQRTVGQLEQKDFKVFEDGAAQEISFFATAEAPFDLVLLIDLSGSTVDKLKLIKKSATGFIESARPTDRIAIVTFTEKLEVVSPLTFDRKDLKERVKKIAKPKGGTNFWDALRYVLETMFNPERTARRSAVVLMTDGVDNALPDVSGPGSETTFDELLELVTRSSPIVIPIYLDTERDMIEARRMFTRDAYILARQQLALIAVESGSNLYYARKVEDLKDVYKQVISDLGTVYSIGYLPTNRARDGSWRTVKVQLNTRPELAARTRRGYFAK